MSIYFRPRNTQSTGNLRETLPIPTSWVMRRPKFRVLKKGFKSQQKSDNPLLKLKLNNKTLKKCNFDGQGNNIFDLSIRKDMIASDKDSCSSNDRSLKEIMTRATFSSELILSKPKSTFQLPAHRFSSTCKAVGKEPTKKTCRTSFFRSSGRVRLWYHV